MRCPKCNGEMRTFDRLGIHVEQCQSCRGIFLDYGELEQIVSTEQQHYQSDPPPLQQPGAPAPAAPMPSAGQPVPPPPPPPGYGYHRPDSPSPYYGHPDSPGPYGYGKGRYGPRRKKSIFEQLFD